MLGVPPVIAPMCPLLNRGTWDMVSFSHMKAYGQSGPSSTNKTSLWATSSRVWRQAWQGCTHMVVMPNTLLHVALMPDATNMNTIYCWGFSTSPHAPTWERVLSYAIMIAHTWKCITAGQKSSKPHLTFVDASYRLMSAERSMK